MTPGGTLGVLWGAVMGGRPRSLCPYFRRGYPSRSKCRYNRGFRLPVSPCCYTYWEHECVAPPLASVNSDLRR